MAIGTALVGTALLAGGSALSASSNKKAAKKAADASQYAADQSAAVQREQLQAAQGALNPFVQAGMPATNSINALLGLAGQDAQNDAFGGFEGFLDKSDYTFNLGRGLNAVNSGYAGRGMLKSGAAMRGIEDYRQGLNKQYLGQYMGALGNQQGVGLSAGSALAGVGQNFANSMSQIFQNSGTDQANAALVRGQNNPFANALGTIGGGLFGLGR
jgi:hypothetical protein